ncbi:hypothetical protein [Streptomyces fuscichromogenes]|nr:hypothetical protein [Streptomyces fuscichromogenes]
MDLVTARRFQAAYAGLGGRGSLTEVLFRLAALTALHGPDAPRELLTALAAEPAAAVGTARSFLATGRPAAQGTGGLVRELLAHRPAAPPYDIVHPPRLPPALESLRDLIVLARARLPGGGPAGPGPVVGAGRPVEQPVGGSTILVSPPDRGYALVLARDRYGHAPELAALLHRLRPRLTPSEAAWALWAYIHHQRPPHPVDFLLVTHDDTALSLRWRYRPWPGRADPLGLCRDRLPAVAPIHPGGEILLGGDDNLVTVRAAAATITEVTVEHRTGRPVSALVCATPSRHHPPAPRRAAARALTLLGGYRGPDVTSVACGQVRLDRALGPEQETGVAIGAAVLRRLLTAQRTAPLLTAPMDDDSAPVRLPPRDYRAYLRLRLPRSPRSPLRVVPRSSPLLYAIAAVLYRRLLALGLGERVQRHGGSLFIDLGNGALPELVADTAAAARGGGLLLEAALLTYRTAPARFDAYLQDRFGLPVDLHRTIADALDESGGHLTGTGPAVGPAGSFAALTDLASPDPGVRTLVGQVLADAADGAVHLDVLDAYYTAQRQRVRELTTLLRLPFRLLTLHFSTATGEVTFHDTGVGSVP